VSRISREHRWFLIVDQGIGPIVVNLLLNGVIAWVMFRSARAVPLWGQSSIAADTLATAFILPLLTSLIVSRVVRYQVRRGRLAPLAVSQGFSSRWARRASWQRGAALGVAAVVLTAVPVVVLLSLTGPMEMGLWRFVWFKAAFAAGLGVLVTPLLGWWALASASSERTQ
jgi:hypothetical protein